MPRYSLCLPTFSTSTSTSLPISPPPHGVKFRISHRENLRYLKTLRIIDPNIKPQHVPPPPTLAQILSHVNFYKSKGFSDPDFSRLASLRPEIFHPDFNPAALSPVLQFLADELPATTEECCGLIVRCPDILLSDVDYMLRPTLQYLKQLGIQGLNSPTTLNARLLNTRVQTMKLKIRFLRSVGFSYEEATQACARVPAIFGYGTESNLSPKYEYLVMEMERDVEELKRFPQYFGFSLEKRIRPRHLYLKDLNIVRLSLRRMLLPSDANFFARWK